MDRAILTTINNLRKNNMAGYFVKDERKLIELLEHLIERNALRGARKMHGLQS